MHITRAKVGLASLAMVAAGVPLATSLAAGATAAAKPAAGIIHVYIVNTSTSATAPNKILITGAFSDHGTAKHGVWHLARGTITVNNSSAGPTPTFFPASCSASGSEGASVPIVKGTGAYKGIRGSFKGTITLAEQGSLLPNGMCNTADSAPAVAEALIVVASGKVSF